MFRSIFLASNLALSSSLTIAAEIVSIDNFIRAETDMTLKR